MGSGGYTPSVRRLTMAQAVVEYLKNQYVERDGIEQPLFVGCFGIFGRKPVCSLYQFHKPIDIRPFLFDQTVDHDCLGRYA